MSGDPVHGAPNVKSSERTLRLVEHLAQTQNVSTLHDLQQDLGIPKSSLHGLLVTMIRCGWAIQRDGGYTLGPTARILGSTQLGEIDIVELADDILTRLRDEVGETVHLATLDGYETLYLMSRSSPHALGVRFQPGRRLPAQITALGKAMLATCDVRDLPTHLPDKYVTPTPKSVRSKKQLLEQLNETRRRGYAIDDEETGIGLRCLAVPVSLPSLAPHALSCPVPVARLDDQREEFILAALFQAREELLRRLTGTTNPRAT